MLLSLPLVLLEIKTHLMYILEFKRVSDTGERYVSETQSVSEIQYPDVTQGLKKLFKDTQ